MKKDSKIILQRAYYKDCTTGRLSIEGNNLFCSTLELPWENNKQRISCIPEGVYPYRIAMSPSRGRNVIWIDKVFQRSAIQIHEGNFTRQIEGCILVGDGIRDINSDNIPDVTNSLAMLTKLMSLISPTGTIEIKTASLANV